MKPSKNCKISKILYAILISSLINGCTYTNKLAFEIKDKPAKINDSKYTLALIDINKGNDKVVAKPGMIELTVESGESLQELIKYNLSPYFKEVYFINDDNKNMNYDYILSYKTNTASVCSRSCYLNTTVSVDVKKNLKDKNKIVAQDFTDQYVYDQPGSTTALAVFSGLTLCSICIITGPIMTNMCGDELSANVSKSNERIASRIVEIIKASDLIQ